MANGDALLQGDKLSIDWMFLNGILLLDIVYTVTHFSAALFLDSNAETYGKPVEGIGLVFVQTWYVTYTGYPNGFHGDQGSASTSE